jgi:hypothetical protein
VFIVAQVYLSTAGLYIPESSAGYGLEYAKPSYNATGQFTGYSER